MSNRHDHTPPHGMIGTLVILTVYILVTGGGFSLSAFENDAVVRQKQMVFLRLRESGLSRIDAEAYSTYMQTALTEATGWELPDFEVSSAIIMERGGRQPCPDLQCHIINGQLLGVDYVCFGSVETIGRTFSLNIQIADVKTGRQVANVSRFYKGKEKNFIRKIIPEVARQATEKLTGISAAGKSHTGRSIRDRLKKEASGAFGDVRAYLAYGSDEGIETEGKLAFGYLVIGRRFNPDDALRYSYQIQSYLADAGGCAMLYIDEMERLMQVRGGSLQCGSRRCARNVGRLLGVDYMAYGRLKKFFGRYILRVYIVDVETGKVIARHRERFKGREIIFLTEIIPQIAMKLGELMEVHIGDSR